MSAETFALGLGHKRDGQLFVPDKSETVRPLPLLVAFHGAGGSGSQMISLLHDIADTGRFMILAPDSRGRTWDAIRGDFGPDMGFLDRALERMSQSYPVDLDQIAVGGFSDGASYALSVGLSNGDVFSHILAFSPGFIPTMDVNGKPKIYISHGRSDSVLPIERCSRRIVSQLQSLGIEVLYREFDEGHTIPQELAEEAVGWFLGPENERRELVALAPVHAQSSGIEQT
ncbi:MAG: alpha/beta hydrolase [Bdellovibrionales bacterium]